MEDAKPLVGDDAQSPDFLSWFEKSFASSRFKKYEFKHFGYNMNWGAIILETLLGREFPSQFKIIAHAMEENG